MDPDCITHLPEMGLKAIPRRKRCRPIIPCTYGYLKRFEEVLRKRAAFKRYFTRKDLKQSHRGNRRAVLHHVWCRPLHLRPLEGGVAWIWSHAQ
jgi:hypothetical protein